MNITATIEISKGSKYKYEIHKLEYPILVLDRVLNQSIPYNYGYIPGTICEDGDALDIFVISNQSILPLTNVQVEVIGAFTCKDNDKQDDKLVGILIGDDVYPNIYTIKQYLQTYKDNFKVLDQVNVEQAIEIYMRSKI